MAERFSAEHQGRHSSRWETVLVAVDAHGDELAERPTSADSIAHELQAKRSVY